MRGFLVGTLVLIAIEVFGQPNAQGALATGGGWLISGMRRLLSPDVAGVPLVASAAAASGTGSGGNKRYPAGDQAGGGKAVVR